MPAKATHAVKEHRFHFSDTRIQAIIKPSQILVVLGKNFSVGATTEGIAFDIRHLTIADVRQSTFDSPLAGKINLWRR